MFSTIAKSSGFRCGPQFKRCEWYSIKRDGFNTPLDFAASLPFSKECTENQSVVRIFSLVQQLSFHSYLIEEHIELENIFRVSFFVSDNTRKPTSEDFLGYAVIQQDDKTEQNEQKSFVFVYEAVLKSHRVDNRSDFLHCRRDYSVEYDFGTLNICGSMYAQQNPKQKFACAQVSLRSALSLLLPNGDISYEKINKKSRAGSPSNGLQEKEIDNILTQLEKDNKLCFRVFKEDYLIKPLYGAIESNCPCLFGFHTKKDSQKKHIVLVLGHTFDEDSCLAYAKRDYALEKDRNYQSGDWLSSFLIHDDNFGPYHTIKKNFFCTARSDDVEEEKIENSNVEKSPSVSYLWCLTVPERKNSLYYNEIKLESDAYISNQLTPLISKILENLQSKLKKTDTPKEITSTNVAISLKNIIPIIQKRQVVLRHVFVGKETYLRHLESYFAEKEILEKVKNLKSAASNSLLKGFWLVEISIPEYFSSARVKFGELLMDGEFKQMKVGDKKESVNVFIPSVLAVRLPEKFFFYSDKDNPITTKITGWQELFSDG
jgi:hypothetical protein